ncbi:MAG: DUF6514 family protein [Oscillospiraceae bacterium]|nr:DUF6514 family protein [Oscillospiraceae bacterium]
METKKVYFRMEEVDGLNVEYFVVEGKAFGVGICEFGPDGKVEEAVVDVVYDIFPTQSCAEEFVMILANHTVLAVSLRDVLCDYFVGKMLA